jgi:phosphate transport system substrate-binding protein
VNANWPDETIKIYSPGTASGTFDYFTEHVNGKAGSSRNDSQITFSENDNVLVQGVSGSKYAIGYFGFSYYEENMGKLNAVFVDGVEPTYTSIQSKSYPISRMLYIYVNKAAISRPEAKEYLNFYMKNVGNLVKGVGYIKLPQSFYDADLAKIQ